MSDMCKHGMPRSMCGYCSAPKVVPGPSVVRRQGGQRRESRSDHPFGIVVVRSAAKGKVDYSKITSHTTIVHIDGCLFLHMARELVSHSQIKTIQMPATMLSRTGTGVKELCAKHEVELVSGLVNPRVSEAWVNTPIRSPDYYEHYQFMHGLSSKQRALLKELIELGFEEAVMAVRYFCLKGEEYCTLLDIAREHGISSEHTVSSKIRTILSYLGCELDQSATVQRILRTIESKIVSLRKYREDQKALQQFCQRVGIERIPEGFPLVKLNLLEAFLLAIKDESPVFLEIKSKKARDYNIVMRRLGLVDGIYHSLGEVGICFDLSSERIRQIERNFYMSIGVAEEQ